MLSFTLNNIKTWYSQTFCKIWIWRQNLHYEIILLVFLLSLEIVCDDKLGGVENKNGCCTEFEHFEYLAMATAINIFTSLYQHNSSFNFITVASQIFDECYSPQLRRFLKSKKSNSSFLLASTYLISYMNWRDYLLSGKNKKQPTKTIVIIKKLLLLITTTIIIHYDIKVVIQKLP